MESTDILIVGCGIIGLAIARELNLRHPDLKLILLEKEEILGLHASGRNSGVIHAGFYYTPDSLKAQFTVEGNRLLTEYCDEKGIPLRKNGKVVVTKDETELPALYELKKRGDANKVPLKLVDERELKYLEPNAKTFKHALYSPTTSSVNPGKVVDQVAEELNEKEKITFKMGESFIKRKGKSVIQTSKSTIEYRHLINCSGLYADKVAHQFGVGLNYSLLPFKGLYMEYTDEKLLEKHIYPVPDLKYPFLGVHYTKTVEGKVKIGPTAIPAFWRENYNGFENFKAKECVEILSADAKLYITNSFNFRKIASEERKKMNKNFLVSQALKLVNKASSEKFGKFLKPGIRAQLYDRKKNKLEMDFVVEHGANSTHILNAVSPAFTCSFSFSKYVVDGIRSRLH